MITPNNKSMKQLSKKAEDKSRVQFTKRLAKHIKRIRKEKKVTQEELAFQAELNSAYIGHLERGIYSPTLFVIWKIAKALKMKLWEFLKDF